MNPILALIVTLATLAACVGALIVALSHGFLGVIVLLIVAFIVPALIAEALGE